MRTIILLFTLFFISQLQAQIKEFSALDLTNTIKEIGFKPVKKLKNFNQIDLKKFVLSTIQNGLLHQLNIDAWFLCENKREEGFQIYTLYYKKIPKTYYNSHCKEINAIMEIDGVVQQPR